jgi:hypothetical protein
MSKSETTDLGPETQRLVDRLTGDPERKLVNFHVSWGAVPPPSRQRSGRLPSTACWMP